jgi:hypothetical protein
LAKETIANFVEISLISDGNGPDVDAIEAALEGDVLPRVMKYWRGLCGDGVPFKDRFDPVDLGSCLRHIFLTEKLADGDYLFRVVGSFFVAGAGFDGSMRRMSEYDQMVGRDEIRQVYDQTLATGGPRLDFMYIPWRDREWRSVMRLLLPLADSRGRPRYLIGASDHRERGRG